MPQSAYNLWKLIDKYRRFSASEPLIDWLRRKGESHQLNGCELIGINFRGIDLSRIDFSNSNLTQSDFTECNLKQVNFVNANLYMVDISLAKNLESTQLENAKNIENLIACDVNNKLRIQQALKMKAPKENESKLNELRELLACVLNVKPDTGNYDSTRLLSVSRLVNDQPPAVASDFLIKISCEIGRQFSSPISGINNPTNNYRRNSMKRNSDQSILDLSPISKSTQALSTTFLETMEQHVLGSDYRSFPALMAVVDKNHSQLSQLISQDQTCTQRIDARGNSPLHLASVSGEPSLLALFIEKHLVTNNRNSYGLTPLQMCIAGQLFSTQGSNQAQRLESLTQLLDHGALVTKTCSVYLADQAVSDLSTLTLAILLGDVSIVEQIILHSSQQNNLQNDRLTTCALGHVLHVAIVSRNGEMLKTLLTHSEASVRGWAQGFLEKTNSDGQTPLAFAARVGNTNAIQQLITAGVNRDARNNNNGQTALHHSVLGKQPESIDMLIRLNADHTLLSQKSESLTTSMGEEDSDEDVGETALQLADRLYRKNSNSSERSMCRLIRDKLKNIDSTKAGLQGFITDNPDPRRVRNLVIQGGGAKGVAYVGAFEELEKKGVLLQLERVAGTSAGAISALLVALKFSAKEIGSALQTLTVTELLGDQAPLYNNAQAAIEGLRAFYQSYETQSYWQRAKGTARQIPAMYDLLKVLSRIQETTALSDGEALKYWLSNLVKQKLQSQLGDKYNDPAIYDNLTFGRLKELVEQGHARHLHVFVTNITVQEVMVMSSELSRWSDVNVVEAVCASAALPFAFKRRRIRYPSATDPAQTVEHEFIDGGLVRNNPIDHFDAMIFQAPHIDQRLCWQRRSNQATLGLCLDSNKIPENEAIKELSSSTEQAAEETMGLVELLCRIGKIFYWAESLLQGLRGDIQDRSILIPVGEVGTAEFGIVEDPKKLKKIIHRGAEAIETYFTTSETKKTVSASSSNVAAKSSDDPDSDVDDKVEQQKRDEESVKALKAMRASSGGLIVSSTRSSTIQPSSGSNDDNDDEVTNGSGEENSLDAFIKN